MSDDDGIGGDGGEDGGKANRNIFLQMSLPSLSIQSAMNDDIDDNQIDKVEEELKQISMESSKRSQVGTSKKKKKKAIPSIFKKNNTISAHDIQPMEITQTFAFKDNSGAQHKNPGSALAAFLNDVDDDMAAVESMMESSER